jgi:hypothetical protein
MMIDVTDGERQVILLALAELALSRPGWNPMLLELGVRFAGGIDFEEFKRLNAERVKPLPASAYCGEYPVG